MLEKNCSAENRQQEAYDLRDDELEKKKSQPRWILWQKAAFMCVGTKNQARNEGRNGQKLKETCHNIMYIYFYD